MSDKKAASPDKPHRQPLAVACSIDVDTPAVFHCSRCKKPFCEECIGHETATETLCLQCAGIEEILEEEAKKRSRFGLIRHKRFVLTLFALLAGMGIAINGTILYSNHRESDQTEAGAPALSPQLRGIAECRANLEALVAEALTYRQMTGHFPASLEALTSILDPETRTEDPISHEPYILEVDRSGNITARCPTPESHGVASITAVPHKPARLTYLGSGIKP